MDGGVQHCEEKYLELARQYQLCKPKEVVMTLEDTLRGHNQLSSFMVGQQLDYGQITSSLLEYMEVSVCLLGMHLGCASSDNDFA